MSEFFSFYGELAKILEQVRAYLQSNGGIEHMAWIAIFLGIPFNVVYRAVCHDRSKTLKTDGHTAWEKGVKAARREEAGVGREGENIHG